MRIPSVNFIFDTLGCDAGYRCGLRAYGTVQPGALRGDDANSGGVGQAMGIGMIGAVFFQRHQLGLQPTFHFIFVEINIRRRVPF